jgi:ABC-type branched-subunit amino acid transport system substrate-binding protein
MKRGWVKWTWVAAVVGLLAALGGGSAVGQTTTTTGGSTASYGPGTDGNAKAAKLVQNDPLTGPKGTGLTRGVTSSSVKIGCYLDKGSFAGADDGFEARFERANKNKELPGGRTIDFVGCKDDGANPQTDLTVVQSLVQQDQVFAVVGIANTFLTPSTDFLNNNQVPYYGWGFLPGFCGTRWAFGFDGCIVTGFPGQKHTVYQANLAEGPIEAGGLTAKTTKVALQGQDNDAGTTANKTISALFEQIGAKVVYEESNIPSPSAGVNFTPYVSAINAANPNVLLNLNDFPTTPGFTAAMTQSGYQGENVNYVAYVPGLLSSSASLADALNGALVSSQIVPQEAQTPYIKQIETDLQAVNSKTGKFITLSAAIAYAEADVLVSQLKAVGSTLNTKTFDQKINNGNYTYKASAEGGPGQMSFPSMHFIASDCAAMLKITGMSYTQVVPFTCYPSVIAKGSKK